MKIDKNIPIPSDYREGEKKTKYPFKKLEIGDSFIYNNNKDLMSNRVNNLIKLNRIDGKDFTWSRTEEGIRIWRTK